MEQGSERKNSREKVHSNLTRSLMFQGLDDAFGLMVNYRYFPEKTQENNRKYSEEKIIDISDDVLKLLSPTS